VPIALGVWQATSAEHFREVTLPTPTTLEALQAQVLQLSKSDRSRLLDRLVASLDVDVQAEEAWEQLAEQREEDVRSGQVVAVPLEDAMARLRARYPG
jgi:putative addiction module component (TIGR02574 family)